VGGYDKGMPAGHKKIGRQIVLPFSKAFEIAWKSIRIRIWRSLITMSGIVLAIAFLMSIWTAGSVTSALQDVPEDDPRYLAIQRALQQQAIQKDEVSIRTGIIGEELAVGEDQKAFPHVNVRDALQERLELNPLLVPAQESALRRGIETQDNEDKFDALIITSFPQGLATPSAMKLITEFVEGGGTLMVFGYEQLWPAGVDESVRKAFTDLLPADPAGAQAVKVSPGAIRAIKHGAISTVRWNTHPDLTYLAAGARSGVEPLVTADGKGIIWLAQRGEGSVFWFPVAGQHVVDRTSLDWFLKGRLVVSNLRWGSREKFMGATSARRNLWLVSLSLLVCIVGITNAMLMSVTERFREIGTMKCLGALDKFVGRLFLIESSLQGAAGSLLGVLLGFLLAFVRAMFAYHVADPLTGESYWLTFPYFPWLTVLLWAAIAIVVGISLSMLAAILPAKKAATMEPVVAMRVEA